jgi:hypothetical protein
MFDRDTRWRAADKLGCLEGPRATGSDAVTDQFIVARLEGTNG